jgi:LysM repeat protein
MGGRSPARFLAPLALVAFALALLVVVNGSTNDDGSTPAARDTSQPAQSTATPGRDGEGRAKNRRVARTYTIKTGDTPSGIAERVGVPLEQILSLNPDLDPQTLTPGTEIKLR